MMHTHPNLLAIVAVEPSRRVLCQQPHCGHSVYARIHIVEESGQLLVLGSDCYARKYGITSTSNFQGFGGGAGRTLTDVERELLVDNTAGLLAQFKHERAQDIAREEMERARAAAELEVLRARQAEQSQRHAVMFHGLGQSQDSQLPAQQSLERPIPLPSWAALKKPYTSFFAYGMDDGTCWVVMQTAEHDGCLIVPAPTTFESWEEALTPRIGTADMERDLYVSNQHINVIGAWFSQRARKGSRIDSDAVAIQKFALSVAGPTGPDPRSE